MSTLGYGSLHMRLCSHSSHSYDVTVGKMAVMIT